MPKETKSDIRVECAYDKMVATNTLKPNPRNPNTHPEQQIAMLAQNIQAMGWRHPIVVSNRSGMIVAGHARFAAARMLGCAEVPVDFQDYATQEDEYACLIADNRLAELAEMNTVVLKDLLLELDTGAFDMDLTGFDIRDLESLMTVVPPASSGQALQPLGPAGGAGGAYQGGGEEGGGSGVGSATDGRTSPLGRVLECPYCHKEIMI